MDAVAAAVGGRILRELAVVLNRLADAADRVGAAHETFDRYGVHLDTERSAADGDGWRGAGAAGSHRPTERTTT
ncbi:hypothetical protein [Rhodococcus sp. SGAir0479]|uniref:hypothetical protein n=1 Tax=Rhodococcus sp. SGAir0479 TaxID=2567884 RepID=UPI0010CCB4EA|nr:hypothetical protein [Rhodococcus sp. SGAir0479]QCQ93442.1 hypothetical protein E7742_20955 [Rhodococcus sp. SGAir0479]